VGQGGYSIRVPADTGDIIGCCPMGATREPAPRGAKRGPSGDSSLSLLRIGTVLVVETTEPNRRDVVAGVCCAGGSLAPMAVSTLMPTIGNVGTVTGASLLPLLRWLSQLRSLSG